MNKIKKLFEIIKYCFILSWKSSKTYTIIRLFSKMIIPLLVLVLAYNSKMIIDVLTSNYDISEKKSWITVLLIIEIGIGIFSAIMRRIDEYIENVHNDMLNKDLSENLMDYAIVADLEFFDNSKYYDKFETVQRDMQSITSVIWSAIGCLSSIITFVCSFIIVSNINIVYALLMVAVIIPSSIVSKKYMKILYRVSLDQINGQRKLNYLFSIVADRQHACDIRLYNIGKMIKERYDLLWKKMFRERKNITKKKSILISVLDSMPYIIRFGLIIEITFNIIEGSATVGDYTLYISVLEQLYSSVYTVSSNIVRIYEQKLRIENVKSFEKMENKVNNTGTKTLKSFNKLEFCNVSFMYPGTQNYVIKNINFTIDAFERVALVGLNGSGKSTIIKLIMRFYDVNQGEIKINDRNICEYDIFTLRKIFSTCFQTPTIYGFSLRDNIILGDFDAYEEDKKVYEALENSDGSGILNNAEGGLDTSLTRNLDDKGIELSGGQYQKITLARAFYRSGQFVILDEPSAALDPEAENKIFAKTKLLCKDKTVLFTSHRLSNISIADKIIVIENGTIIEQGSHEDLINKRQRYYALYSCQAEKYSRLD